LGDKKDKELKHDMPTLEDAILFAVKAHRGQKDKGGESYILHPLRIMLRMKTKTEMIIAALHDIVEDTHYTVEDLCKIGYSEEILDAIKLLTRRNEETYDEFIQRLKPNPLARAVKIADLEDNMNLERIRNPNENDFRRVEKYKRALAELRKVEE
jgi:(p)ppGpp synthase/HD superfamily hydrolase